MNEEIRNRLGMIVVDPGNVLAAHPTANGNDRQVTRQKRIETRIVLRRISDDDAVEFVENIVLTARLPAKGVGDQKKTIADPPGRGGQAFKQGREVGIAMQETAFGWKTDTQDHRASRRQGLGAEQRAVVEILGRFHDPGDRVGRHVPVPRIDVGYRGDRNAGCRRNVVDAGHGAGTMAR